MNDVKRYLQYLRDNYLNHSGLKSFEENNSRVAARRLWQLLREDLMRLHHADLIAYLSNDQNKLVECGDFAETLARDLEGTPPEQIPARQEALILFCLEQDAARKLREMQNNKVDLQDIQKKLDIWEVHV